MSKLTSTQIHWLQWLDKHGGAADVKGSTVISGEHETNASACVPFLHLVVKGYVEARDGRLRISEKGRMFVNPFHRPALETVTALSSCDCPAAPGLDCPLSVGQCEERMKQRKGAQL